VRVVVSIRVPFERRGGVRPGKSGVLYLGIIAVFFPEVDARPNRFDTWTGPIPGRLLRN